MAEFIANAIMNARDTDGLYSGRAKYEAYFKRTRIYERFREKVETILATDGYGDCIVE